MSESRVGRAMREYLQVLDERDPDPVSILELSFLTGRYEMGKAGQYRPAESLVRAGLAEYTFTTGARYKGTESRRIMALELTDAGRRHLSLTSD